MVLNPENTAIDSEGSFREVIENEKISIDNLVGILDSVITGLEQEIISLYRIKERILAQKKQLKQLALKEMFNKINK
ncbi:hypothetical protein X975_09850, partial [Stegodyphus mimosarum]